MAVQLNSSNFSEEIKKHKVAMVDFWADWCGPCKALGPVIEEIASEYGGKALVAKVDTDANRELAKGNGVMGIPCVIFFKDGAEAERSVGLVPKKTLTDILNKLL